MTAKVLRPTRIGPVLAATAAVLGLLPGPMTARSAEVIKDGDVAIAISDLTMGSVTVDWIEQLANDGITTGCGDGNYCPTQVVKRDQMAAFLTTAFGL